jgi:hypothetical protein
MEKQFTTDSKQTQWLEHPNQLQGKIPARIIKKTKTEIYLLLLLLRQVDMSPKMRVCKLHYGQIVWVQLEVKVHVVMGM